MLVISAAVVTFVTVLIWSRTIDIGDMTTTLVQVLLLTVFADIALAAFFYFRVGRR
jgi:hypothetical protein